MTVLLAAAGVGVAIVGLALILPCQACRKRRERFRAAYAVWKAQKKS